MIWIKRILLILVSVGAMIMCVGCPNENGYTSGNQYNYNDSNDILDRKVSEEEMVEVKKISDAYCNKVKNNDSSIVSIKYTGEGYGYGNDALVEYFITYNSGIDKIGTVVLKKSENSWRVIGMKLEP